MSISEEFIIEQLKAIPSDRHLQIKGSSAFIRCPMLKHKGGYERTPSFRIFIDESKRNGDFFCYGCGVHGNWNDLAEIFNLKKLSEDRLNGETYSVVTEASRNQLLVDEEELQTEKDDVYTLEWSSSVDWRGISGKLLSHLNALEKFDERTGRNKLYLPVKMWGEEIGHVMCEIAPEKGQTSYINKAGSWIKGALFPYDYVASFSPKTVALVEGPRDALNLCQHGFPALACLGSKTVWSDKKADALLDFSPMRVVLAFDPDDPGQRVSRIAAKALHRHVRLAKINFPDEKDAADLNKNQVAKLLKKFKIKEIKSWM